MSPSETSALVELLAGAFPERPVTERMLAAYSAAWIEEDPADMRRAAIEYLRTGRFFPFPGDLIALARTDGSEEDEAHREWAKVIGQVRDVGSWGTPSFVCGITRDAMRVLGDWRPFCETLGTPGHSLDAARARFLDAYKARARAEARAESIARAQRILAINLLELKPKALP